MNIIPKLNLNDNPRLSDNLSLNDSYNMMLSKDGNLTTENSLQVNSIIQNSIESYIGSSRYSIIYCISCNVELVLFVWNKNNNKFIIFRYNEEYNKCYAIIDNFEYFGGKLIGDFTYNKENLIISIGEYIEEGINNIPLKVINLGKFPTSKEELDKQTFINPDDKLALYDNRLHPICPEVIIPKVTTERINGNSYKGWYYIFIRYKISNNTYTKWLNTNESIFVDEYHQENIIDYHISQYWNTDDEFREKNEAKEDTAAKIEITEYISNNTDISSNSFKMTFDNLDSKYNIFQVALICLSKSYTKGFKSEDIKIYKDENNNSVVNVVNFSGFNEYAVGDIIKSYYNYYNVKTLHSYNNRLYIGNYNEYEKTIDVSDISIKIDFFRKDVSSYYVDKQSQPNTIKAINEDVNLLSNNLTKPIEDKTIIYGGETIHYIDSPISFIRTNSNNDVVETRECENGDLVTIGLRLSYLAKENNQTIEIPVGKYYHTVEFKRVGLLIGYEIEWTFNYNSLGEVTGGQYSIIKTGKTSFRSLCLISGEGLYTDFAPWLKFIQNKSYIKINDIFNTGPINEYRNYFFIAITHIENGEVTYNNYNSNGDIIKVNNNDVPFYTQKGSTISFRKDLYTDPLFGNKWFYKDPDINRCWTNDADYKEVGDKTFICNPYSWEMDWFKKYAEGKLIDEPVTPITPTDKEQISSSYSNKIIDSCGLSTNEYYSFYIHFINKYGEVTKGYPLSMFDIENSVIGNAGFKLEVGESRVIVGNNKSFGNNYAYVDKITNKLGLLLLSLKYRYNDYIYDNTITNTDGFYKYYFKFTIDKIPDDYIGYFMSCEKLDKTLLYAGLAENSGINQINFYNDRLNFDDSIDFMFNKVVISKCNISFPNSTTFNHIATQTLTEYDSAKTYDVLEKNVKVCDAFNNIGRSTCLVLKINKSDIVTENNDYIIKNCYFCCLINSDHENKYCNNNKYLIPCSQVNYSTENPVIGNPKTVFVTNNTVLYYMGNFYNTGLNIFQKPQEVNRSVENIHAITFKYKDYVPFESVCFNNKPTVVFFPFIGLSNTSKDTEQSFKTGCIVESKNTYDLFELRQITYDTQYPAILNNYDKNIIYTDTFAKTIRRSNVIQDESSVNNWRKFEVEQYKNINENKGSIVKIFGLGYTFMVHTEHSLFVFKSLDSIKSSNENTDIQLASIDIWDVNYQEFFTSKLGFGGISKEHHGIVDTFGYIWYDKYNNRLYRIDNNKFNFIDSNIKCYLDNIRPDDVVFANDKEHNRLIMCFYKNGIAIDTISYNYSINEFISRHKYYYFNAYNTKKNLYLLDSKYFHNFIEGHYLDIGILPFYNNDFAGAYIDIIVNINYFDIKFIESIRYKLNQIITTQTDDNKRTKVKNIYYPGDYIRIYNDINDTGNIDAKTSDPNNNINKVENYNKPYWNLGNWNFSCIRNNIADYINNQLTNKEVSRFYGNYFIVRFIFDYNNNRIEFESLDYKLTDKRI